MFFNPLIAVCINGAYGNLNEKQAATLAKECQSRIVIPVHFGLFMAHGGCPRRFSEYLKTYLPEAALVALTPGRGKMI